MTYERKNPSAPWISRTMAEILEGWLKPGDRGIEWGSGRSTVWFAERVGYLVSVEHNPVWYRRVRAELERKRLQNVEYHLCEDERAYCMLADQFPQESFDFCLVDGLARDCCALAAISLIKPGGILVLDNSNWYIPTSSHTPLSRKPEQGPYSERWADFLDAVEGWRRIWTTNGVFDTAMWVKLPAVTAARNDAFLVERITMRHSS
jgi:predicted O-methyltransferase YrrM